MHFAEIINQFRLVLTSKFANNKLRPEFIEILLILTVGLLCGLFNPNQIAQQLGVSPKDFYSALRELSVYSWRRLLEKMLLEAAVAELNNYNEASAATKSRMKASIAIDDSLVKRLGQALSYVWAWYSGQLKSVKQGQELLGIVLKINGRILPLRLIWVSKQGRSSTNKPDVLIKAMQQLKQAFEKEGFRLTDLAISMDSWWVSNPVSERLAEVGFDKQIICGKANLVFETKQGRKKLPQIRREVNLEQGWGHRTPAARMRVTNPTLGEVALIIFSRPRSRASGLIAPVVKMRVCEGLRVRLNHYAVETFWKRMKRWLGLGQMAMRGREGAWAELGLRVMAYFLGTKMLNGEVRTIFQLTQALRREGTFLELIDEHFHQQLLALR